MHRTHKIELDPTNKQANALSRAAGVSRFAYNWALARWEEQYEATLVDPSAPRPSQYSLRRELNAIKRKEFPWMLESTKCAPQEAIIDLGIAYKNFFRGSAARPTFKKRGTRDSFRLHTGQFSVSGKRVRVPNIGWIRMRESLRFESAKVKSVTISRRADKWFASILCEMDQPVAKLAPSSRVGIDVGVREYVMSDGTRHQVPRAFRAYEARLARAQRSFNRKQKGSANRKKAALKVARIHAQIADQRKDWLHKLTTSLANSHSEIVIEDLNVKGMLKNKRLAKSVSDASFYEFKRQLTYKTQDRGTSLVLADRWFPSSKLCSECGAKTKHLALSQREWTCDQCGTLHDRDLNAARNLAAYEESTAVGSTVDACGAGLTTGALGVKTLGVQSHHDEAGTGRRSDAWEPESSLRVSENSDRLKT